MKTVTVNFCLRWTLIELSILMYTTATEEKVKNDHHHDNGGVGGPFLIPAMSLTECHVPHSHLLAVAKPSSDDRWFAKSQSP